MRPVDTRHWKAYVREKHAGAPLHQRCAPVIARLSGKNHPRSCCPSLFLSGDNFKRPFPCRHCPGRRGADGRDRRPNLITPNSRLFGIPLSIYDDWRYWYSQQTRQNLNRVSRQTLDTSGEERRLCGRLAGWVGDSPTLNTKLRLRHFQTSTEKRTDMDKEFSKKTW